MSNGNKFIEWVTNSKTLKISIIGILTLLLLIPQAMIQSLIRERQSNMNEVVGEISDKWAKKQDVTGPYISVPVKLHKTYDTINYSIAYIHVLPEELNITGNILPEVRYRGIYKVVAYKSNLKFTGVFKKPVIKENNINENDILWNNAVVSFGIPDMRGIKNRVMLSWNDNKTEMEPGMPSNDLTGSGVSSNVSFNSQVCTFNIDLNLNGSQGLYFVPLGKETNVNISSPWSDPSFDGSFLPDARTVSKNGFTAKWHILNLNRNYPQQWMGNKYDVSESNFGVELLFPVAHYQKANRSAKYALMFIALTFIIIFFSEVIDKKRVHIVQYLLVGIGLIIFYTLLLSLSEQMSFRLAHLISSVAVITLITSYSHSIFKSAKITGFMAFALVILYTFLFTILQMEDYALLIGSIGLFIVLAIIMYISRKIDWGGNNTISEN